MIKALIRKELRENLAIGALGLAVFTLMTVWTGHTYNNMMVMAVRFTSRLSFGSSGLQPLVSSGFLMQTAWLCGLFGAALGWMQIHHERHRDLWAFLMHRPTTRTEIFFGKIIAGLTLYFLAAGLPLAGFLAWDATPGHVAAPFEWAMTLPMLKFFFTGVAFYFGAMLTGLRQARWYVSRGLGLGLSLVAVGAALASSQSTGTPPPAWFWPLLMMIGVGVLAVAAWGSFLSHGQYGGQPVTGKLALTAAMFAGAALASGFIIAMSGELLRPANAAEYTYRSYTMTTNGTIYIIKSQNGHPNEYYDREGKRVISAKTGEPIEDQEFNAEQAFRVWVPVDFGEKKEQRNYQDAASIFFVPVRYVQGAQGNPSTLWYFWRKAGRLVAYDLRSRQPVASLGPGGYAQDLYGNGDRFIDRVIFDQWTDVAWRVLYTPTAAYVVDLDQRTIKPLFTTAGTETIGAAGWIIIGRYFTPNELSSSKLTFQNGARLLGIRDTNVVVVTRHYVRLLTLDGRELLKADYRPGYPDYGDVTVWALEPAGQFALWFDPSVPEKQRIERGLHTHAVWLADGAITRAEDLPDLPRDLPEKPWLMDRLSALIEPLTVAVPAACFIEQPFPYEELSLSLLGALTVVAVGWWLGSRYCIGTRAQIGWGVFHLLFNVFGLLTFLCVQEWAARESCPNCKKLRLVDREQCEHCGAAFAPAETNGTEIFEPLGTN